jgi:hypothetical protein
MLDCWRVPISNRGSFYFHRIEFEVKAWANEFRRNFHYGSWSAVVPTAVFGVSPKTLAAAGALP